MTQTAEATAREQVFLSLSPFFMEAAEGDPTQAKAAAEAMVAGFSPGTTEDLLLAAQTVVYGLAGLDSLRRSAADPDLPASTHLRLRGNANAMHRSAQQCRNALDLRRRQAASPALIPAPAAEPADAPAQSITEADLQAAIKRASAIIAEARHAGQLPPMNRQARRAAKFQAQRDMRAATAQGATAGMPAA